MRPNLAFGPIDSVVQYLVYLSIVVLGVLLPLLVQKWRQRREHARLLARTLLSLRQEIEANRGRLQRSLESIAALEVALTGDYEHYERAWHRVSEAAGGRVEIMPPAADDRSVTLAAPTRTAWEVAQLSQALPLLSQEQLSAFTRAYHLQRVLEESRLLYLDISFKSEAMETPLDLAVLHNIESRLQTLAVARSVVRYHGGLSGSLIAAYDAALSDEPARAATPST
jgi:hypothetical protein